MFESLSPELAYIALACGAFLEGEAVMLAAGALAHAGRLGLLGVIVAGAAGSFVWGQSWFTLGRLLGPRLLASRPAWQSRASVVDGWLLRSATCVVVGGRFIAGMGTVLPAVLGASSLARRRFVLLDGAGALAWSAVLASAGYGAGRGVERFTGRASAVAVVVTLLGVLGVVVLLGHWLGRRALRSAERAERERPSVAVRGERRLVITGDDFGLALPFNEAIELAQREGVLTTASLMLGEAATADAVARARRNPELRVGLHLALCEARPVSAPEQIRSLVNASGAFYAPVVAIVRFCLLAPSGRFRRELEAEVRAQFRAFAASGLDCDHVSGHNNLHLHPVVLPVLVRVAREFGVSAIRVPYEPLVASVRAFGTHVVGRFCVWAVMGAWTAWARRRLRAAGFAVNDQIFGVFDCGALTLERLRSIFAHLPPGTSEIHVHPATRRCPEIERTTPTYAHEAELAALLAPELRRSIVAHDVRLVAGYRELLANDEPARVWTAHAASVDALAAEGSSRS